MSTLLERHVASVHERLVLLAPPGASVSDSFNRVIASAAEHRHLLRQMQRFRGSVYMNDGAIQPHEAIDGLHRTPEDSRSWHLLMVDGGRVSGCAWYMEHARDAGPERLRVEHCALAKLDEWRHKLFAAVQTELTRARRERVGFAEVGGWAVAPEKRGTGEGLLLALATYALGRLMGGVLGLTTATRRHASATILRRLGGSSLQIGGDSVPSYYDPRYRCEMELLRFDSRSPSRRYSALIEALRVKLSDVMVVASERIAGEEGSQLDLELCGAQHAA
jgi:hypothetical protein